MLKRVGLLAVILSAATAVTPLTAFAQDGYYRHRDNYYQGDRAEDRHERREWREHERNELREREWREHERREEWRERERCERPYSRGYYYQPNSYFYFGYGR